MIRCKAANKAEKVMNYKVAVIHTMCILTLMTKSKFV